MSSERTRAEGTGDEGRLSKPVNRREFLKLAGIAGAGLTVAGGFGSFLAACGGGETTTTTAGATTTSAGATTTTAAGATTTVAAGGSPLNAIFGAGGQAAGQGVTLNVGMLLAVTGEGSFFGDVMSKGAKLAAQQIEAAGGPTMKISVGDHQSGKVDAMQSEFRRLMSTEHMQVLETSYGAPTESIAALIKENKLLSFNGGGASPVS